MRISIDATPTLISSAGVKTYLYHWITALCAAAPTSDRVSLFPSLGPLPPLVHDRSIFNRTITASRLAYLKALNTFGGLDLALHGVDVFHSSNMIRQRPRKTRLTTTLHDLTSWLTPEYHTSTNIQVDALFARHIASHSQGCIAVSENTRQDAIRVLGLSPNRIRTIHSGIAPSYFDAAPTFRARPYVLYVGTIEPRKNLTLLLDAWKTLKAGLHSHFDLVITGSIGWKSDTLVSRIQQETVYLGYVPESTLPGLIAGSTIFVYPSLYEGFGFPVAQAMAANVPVITSNVSSMPELTGSAAVLVDPRSLEELRRALTTLLESDSKRQSLIIAGRERAEHFRWEACARKSIDFFRDIAAGVSPA